MNLRTSALAMLAVAAAIAATAALARPRAATDLAYKFTLDPGEAPRVRVELATTGSDSGVTWFEVVREWGGVTTGGDDLTNGQAWAEGGDALAVTRPEPHRWRVVHAPGAALRFTYDIASNTHQSDTDPDTNRRPILNAKLFHCYGDLALVRPAGMDDFEPRHVSVLWEGFEAAGWKVASSFGTGFRPRAFTASLHQLCSSVWIAGDLDLVRREVRGRPLWLAMQRGPWTFEPAALADLAHTIVGMERGFFDDYDYPYFLITLIPVGEPGKGHRSLGGTGLTNSFSLCMVADTPLAGDYGQGMHVPSLLAHEMFHEWDGHTILPVDPEKLCYWFTEGFTDFYTRRLLYRNGLITLDEYARSASKKLADLWTSEVRNAPNQRIEADFWNHDAVKRLPYLRGDVVAMIVDHGIRVRTNGKRSLDDLMRELVRDARSHQARVSTESLLEKFAEYAGPEVAAAVRAIVVDGTTPVLPPDVFAACLEVREDEVAGFDLGFDFPKSRTEGKVIGLVAGSAADRAGLQEGHKLTGWSVAFGDVSKPVTMEILEDGATRAISYEARGPAVRAPRAVVREGAKEPCRGL